MFKPSERYDVHRIGVGGLCIHEEKILMVKLSYGPSQDKYIFPGGLVERGESLSEAVTREVREETNIKTEARKIIFLRHMINDKEGLVSDVYMVIKLDFLDGKPQINDKEIQEVRFIPLDQIENEPIGKLCKHVIRKVNSDKGIVSEEYEPTEKIEKELGILKYVCYG